MVNGRQVVRVSALVLLVPACAAVLTACLGLGSFFDLSAPPAGTVWTSHARAGLGRLPPADLSLQSAAAAQAKKLFRWPVS